MQLPQVSSASLRKEEVIAVVLYTGPMVSCLLRKTEQTTISEIVKVIIGIETAYLPRIVLSTLQVHIKTQNFVPIIGI